MKVIISIMATVITVFIIALMLQIGGVVNWVAKPNMPEKRHFSDYPLNYELHGEVKRQDDQVLIVHKVTYNSDDDNYIYYYRINYKGDDEIAFISWEVIDTALQSLDPVIITLKPGESEEFTYHDPSPPIMTEGVCRFYKELPQNDLERLNINADNGNFYDSTSSGLAGPIPSSFLENNLYQ